MLKGLRLIGICAAIFFAVSNFGIMASAQNANTLKACASFKAKLTQEGLATFATLEVPLDYHQAETSPKISVFYWLRKGTDPAKTPLLLIHGGVGGNSSRYYEVFKNSTYPGDILAIDNRNEGCSNVQGYQELPANYAHFRARNVVHDLERLRMHLYGTPTKWRIFGQSRGGAISHYYLEMYPEALESVQTHGWTMMTEANMRQYTFLRSHYSARASDRFALKFPDAAAVLRQAQDHFELNKTCLPLNLGQADLPPPQQPQVCGRYLTDGVSYRLSNFAKWGDLATQIVSLKNPDGQLDVGKAVSYFQKELNANIYVQYFNYILGTNGLDVGSPSPHNFERILQDPQLMQALISEGRFVANLVYPAYLALGFPGQLGDVDPVDYSKIMSFLRQYQARNGERFHFTLFSSFYDTVAGPEMFWDEKTSLGDMVEVFSLHNSGHEGWQTEPDVMKRLLR